MLLGFTGKLGSGKDTAGERLVELLRLDGERLSFAGPLKASAAALLDIASSDWEVYKNDPDVQVHLSVGYREPLLGLDCVTGNAMGEIVEPDVIRSFTAREFLQRYGTESHRDVFGDDFWVQQALRHYFHSSEIFFYVTDVRFPNEAQAIISRGGFVVRVVGVEESTGGHASEARLADQFVSFEIDNAIRDDDYASLDQQLVQICLQTGLPLKERY